MRASIGGRFSRYRTLPLRESRTWTRRRGPPSAFGLFEVGHGDAPPGGRERDGAGPKASDNFQALAPQANPGENLFFVRFVFFLRFVRCFRFTAHAAGREEYVRGSRA